MTENGVKAVYINYNRYNVGKCVRVRVYRLHTGERAAILKLHFHEFDEKELLRAEFL